MSLEDALNKNTAAVLAHTAVLEKMLALGGKATAAADKPAAAGKPAADKPATTPAKTTTNKSKGEPTLEILTAKITAFLKTGDAETRAERKSQAGQIIEHYGVERFTAIPAEHWTEALSGLADFEAGNIPAFLDMGGGDDGDGDDGESMV